MSVHSTTERIMVAIEMSNKTWRLAFSKAGDRKIRQKSIRARDRVAFMGELAQAKVKLGVSPEAAVTSCYEAGRDGFWPQRWLESEGVECLILDPASIEVNRRKRRAKTDRLDAQSLARLLRRYMEGDEDVFAVVRVPAPEDEDALRLHRELERLKKERTAHTARIKSLLILQGIYLKGSIAGLAEDLDNLRQWDGTPLPLAVTAEISRELVRLGQTEDQIKILKKQKEQAVENPATKAQEQTRDLLRLKGVGEVSSWSLAHEFFGWRDFKNRRQVGSLSGLVPTPYDSGGSRVEQGISKAGNRRVRRIMIELAWSWVRFQPDSELTKWFERRFGHGSKRMRRIGIVALARKLLIALWKYLEKGEIPAGAVLQ